MKIFNICMAFVFLFSGILFLCDPLPWVSTWLGTANVVGAYFLAAMLFIEHAAET